MAENFAARKNGKYKIVGLAPDMCFTPGIQPPIPYPVTATLAPSKSTVNSVKFSGKPTFVYDQSFVPTTIGDAPGRNKGVVSGTVEGDCWSIEHSPDTNVGGHPLNRGQDMFAMNGKANGGRGGNFTKKETWERRKALIEKGKQSSDPQVQDAAKRLEQNNVAVEKARLADHVYEPRDPSKPTPAVPEGWKDISNDPKALEKYNLKPEDLRIAGNKDFRSRVYEPDEAVFGKDMSASVVFRGTRPTSGNDWKNNAKQGLNMESDYYRQAVKIGSRTKLSGSNIDCVGHSLGGGMASACSRAGDKTGWTYNSAGLHPKTVERYGGAAGNPATEKITAYRVKGEILTAAQEPGFWGGAAVTAGAAAIGSLLGPIGALLGGIVGGVLTQLPAAIGTKHDLEGGVGNALDKHDMSQVIRCIEIEKAQDEEILTNMAGG